MHSVDFKFGKIGKKYCQMPRKLNQNEQEKLMALKREWVELRSEYEQGKARLRSIELWIVVMSERRDELYTLHPLWLLKVMVPLPAGTAPGACDRDSTMVRAIKHWVGAPRLP
jgi:hypothetical protein